MNIHYLQHVPFENLGSIAAWAHKRGHQVSATHLYRDEPPPSLASFDWLIVMGGPMGVHDEAEYPWLAAEKRFIEQAIAAGKTVLGVCLGSQLIACVLGARVYRNAEKEIGWFPIQLTEEAKSSTLFADLPITQEVFHWHGDTFDLPAGAIHMARSAVCENQAFVIDRRVVGLQFHLETTRQSAQGLIENCHNELVPARFIQTAEEMLADEKRFTGINRTMEQLLDRLAQSSR
jgi:GMP synthase-like glutamine amidotransferase